MVINYVKGKKECSVHPITFHEDTEGEYRYYTSIYTLTSKLDGMGV